MGSRSANSNEQQVPQPDKLAPRFAGYGNAYGLAAADVGKYIRLTDDAAKTINVRPNSTEALPANGEWHFRNADTGDATFDEGSGVTVNPPADGTLVVPPGGTVSLKRVATDTFDLIGVTVPA